MRRAIPENFYGEILPLFVQQRHHGVYGHRPLCRDVTGEQRGDAERPGRAEAPSIGADPLTGNGEWGKVPELRGAAGGPERWVSVVHTCRNRGKFLVRL